MDNRCFPPATPLRFISPAQHHQSTPTVFNAPCVVLFPLGLRKIEASSIMQNDAKYPRTTQRRKRGQQASPQHQNQQQQQPPHQVDQQQQSHQQPQHQQQPAYSAAAAAAANQPGSFEQPTSPAPRPIANPIVAHQFVANNPSAAATAAAFGYDSPASNGQAQAQFFYDPKLYTNEVSRAFRFFSDFQ